MESLIIWRQIRKENINIIQHRGEPFEDVHFCKCDGEGEMLHRTRMRVRRMRGSVRYDTVLSTGSVIYRPSIYLYGDIQFYTI